MTSTDTASTSESGKWVAISLALPEYVHLETVTSVLVNDDYLRHRGVGPDKYDTRWLRTPLPVQIGWRRIEKPVHPTVELALVAADVLDSFVSHTREKPIAETKPEFPHATTVAVCVIPVTDSAAVFNQYDGLLDIVTLSSLIVSDTVRSVRLMTGMPLKDLTYRRMSSIVPTLTGVKKAEAIEWSDGPTIFLQHSMGDLISGAPLSQDEVVILGQVFYQWSIGRPAVIVRDHMGRAAAATEVGDYPGALTAYATACEVCLDNLLTAMMWEEGVSPAEAAAGWDNSFANRIKRNFASRLGGNWRMTTSAPLLSWSRDVARPRHRIVHAGDTADPLAVKRAGEATDNLFSFVTELLVKRGTTYPKTISLLLGRESIERYGGDSTADLLAAHEDHNDKWERSFELWRKQWFELVWSS